MVRRSCKITTAFRLTKSLGRQLAVKAPAKQWTPWKRRRKNCPLESVTNGPANPTKNACLCLAALYESWSIPLSVILVVPLGVLGALLATKLRGLPNDVYFKVGLLTIVGLATKNAILIIEYAKDLQAEGKGLIEAVLEAVHLRPRPILMTSFAFILGVMPLALSVGAGSASRNAIGTGVAGGMFAATALGLFLIPVFYVVVRTIFSLRSKSAPIPEPGTDISGGRQEPIV